MATETTQTYEGTGISENWRNAQSPGSDEGGRGYGPSQGAAPSGLAVNKLRGLRIEFGPSRKDILNFTNQLAVMIRAGISLQDALEGIGEQCDNQKFKAVIRLTQFRLV